MESENHIVDSSVGPITKPRVYTTDTLIIDDEDDIRYLLGNILKQRNISATFASTLSEANTIINQSGIFSIIFLDNYLPDGLGINYIKEIKKKCPKSKLVMITAHDNAIEREKASFEGVDYFIGKPFSREFILKAIDSLSG